MIKAERLGVSSFLLTWHHLDSMREDFSQKLRGALSIDFQGFQPETGHSAR